MLFRSEPNFVHRLREPRYFVSQLDEHSLGYRDGYRYSVELLLEHGEAGAFVLFTGDESPLACAEYPIPEVVFRAAFGPNGYPGNYVTSSGEASRRDPGVSFLTEHPRK
jgi:hypothetical protein